LKVYQCWRKAAKGNPEEIAVHEECNHCPQWDRELKKRKKKEVPGLDKLLLIEGAVVVDRRDQPVNHAVA